MFKRSEDDVIQKLSSDSSSLHHFEPSANTYSLMRHQWRFPLLPPEYNKMQNIDKQVNIYSFTTTLTIKNKEEKERKNDLVQLYRMIDKIWVGSGVMIMNVTSTTGIRIRVWLLKMAFPMLPTVLVSFSIT
jgi:hypothetical protein